MASSNPSRPTILIVDDTPANIDVLLKHLGKSGFKVLVAESGDGALEQLKHTSPDLILLDVMMPGIDGFETCRQIKATASTADIPVIFMTALSDVVDKMKGFKAGAVDYVTKPFQHEEVEARINAHLKIKSLERQLIEANHSLEKRVAQRTADLSEALEEVKKLKDQLQAENHYLKEEIKLNHNFDEIIGKSKTVRVVLGQIERVAYTDATVLLLGETGTGKELFARAIHNRSQRADRPLLKLNCAALPENLIESELFGHERGAFTGAIAKKAGRFELANKGTLFLDEIGDLPLALQAKLLRVLQEGEFERLGSARTQKVDVRVIAATNRDLPKMIADNEFREDLYYRLNVFPINLPPLRDRAGDVPLLVNHFINKYNRKLARNITSIPDPVMTKLSAYPWPGNVRELENYIERSLILSDGDTLRIDNSLAGRSSLNPNSSPASASQHLTLAEAEKAHILKTLESTEGRVRGKGGAAELLDINSSTLRSRMKKLGIEKGGYS